MVTELRNSVRSHILDKASIEFKKLNISEDTNYLATKGLQKGP
jgi:hypothetical protein